MKTKEPFLTDPAVLKHLGDRLRQLRLRRNITQSQLSKDAGVGKSTIERFENGASIQLTSLIRILRSLNKLDELMELIPDQRQSPMQLLMQEDTVQYRASRKKNAGKNGPWEWGDE